MAKYISSIKDLVIHAMTNAFAINEKAKSNDAEACFQMGMIHLLGVNTPIDFKKAKQYLENESLKDNLEALLLLGLAEELEGDYSLAFQNYSNVAKLDSANSEKPYIYNVAKGREHLRSYLKTLGLSINILNNTISKILEDYSASRILESSIQVAMICRDEATCVEAVHNLCEAGDRESATTMLQLCHIDLSKNDHIRKMLFEKKEEIVLSNSIQVIDIEGNSFLSELDFTPYFDAVSRAFNELALQRRKAWEKEIKQEIEQEKVRVQKELEEERARIKRQKEEEERQAFLQEQAEEEERKKKRKKIIAIVIAVLVCLIFGPFGLLIVLCVWGYFWYTNKKKKKELEENGN